MGMTLLRGLQLVVLVVVILHILSLAILLAWDDPRSLFGKGSYILNRYSSTHTMHIHKINHVHADAPSDPMHWDALGLIIPAIDESAQIHRYKLGRTGIRPYNASDCIGGAMPACLLENNAGDYLLLNGESLSILSEISPSVYFAALLTVYLLSSIPYVESVVSFTAELKESSAKILRKGLMIVILVVYFCGLLAAYAGSPFKNMTSLKIEEDVYYSTSSHVASILVCVLTVLISLLHLRGKNSNLYIDVSGRYSSVPDDETRRQTQQEEQKVISDTQTNPTQPEPPVLSPLIPSKPPPPPRNDSNQPNPVARTRVWGSALQSQSVNENGYSTNIAGVREKTDSIFSFMKDLMFLNPSSSSSKHGQESLFVASGDNGPFSSEASVLISITLFLGGVGNIGMSHGVVLEIETQLVLACTLGFAVLEVCSYRLEAYYFFIFDILLKDGSTTEGFLDEKETYYTGIYFIRSVVLVLQSWLLVLYNNTVAEMGYTYSAPERVVFALTTLYLLLQVLIHLYQISLVGWGAVKTASFFWRVPLKYDNPETWHEKLRRAHYYVEILFCVISFFAIFGALFGYAMSNGLDPEDTLVRYEKMQYGLTADTKINRLCGTPGTYSNVKLIGNELEDDEVKGDAKWTESDVDPIDLKVFFWTKYWNLDMSRIPMNSMPVWFCSNGFEHHWMQCLSNDQTLPKHVIDAETAIARFS